MAMITRAEYLARSNEPGSFRAYYAQFVDDDVRALVARLFGVDVLLSTSDQEHFNSVPLHQWDRAVGLLPPAVVAKLREAGDFLSLGTGVCVLKEAARQLVESARSKPDGAL